MNFYTPLPAGDWLQLIGHLMLLSLLAVGGAMAVAPDAHRVLVDELGLLDDAQFNASIAIAQSAPGPNSLYVAVLGYQAAGLLGAIATLAAMTLPSSTLAFVAGRWSRRRRERLALRAFHAGMAPVAIALLAATAWLMAEQMPGYAHFGVTLVTALLVWRTRVHLLLLIAAGAALGVLGWI